MNVELLEQVKQAILAEPLQFQMGDWFTDRLSRFSILTRKHYDMLDAARETIPNCGTAACIAGHTLVVIYKMNPKEAKRIPLVHSVGAEARRLLDIKISSDTLFLLDCWPSELKQAYITAPTPEEQAQIAAKRIDLFIQTNGEQ